MNFTQKAMNKYNLPKKMILRSEGRLTGKEMADLHLELENSTEAKREYNDYQTIWDQSRKVEFPDFDQAKARTNFWQKAEKKHNTTYFSMLLKVAAVLVVGLFIAYGINYITGKDKKEQFVEIVVNKGEKLTINLPDGNKVWLNSNSSIKYPANFTGSLKRIEITGEAYFEIRNNSDPIMIAAGNNIINSDSALFNIKCRGIKDHEQTEIIVQKGWVSLSSPVIPENYLLTEGYKASISQAVPLLVSANNPSNDLAWKTGELVFSQSSLYAVAQDLTNYYGVPVKIEGNLKYCEFTSHYKNIDLSEVLKDISRLYKPEITMKPNEIIIQGNNECL